MAQLVTYVLPNGQARPAVVVYAYTFPIPDEIPPTSGPGSVPHPQVQLVAPDGRVTYREMTLAEHQQLAHDRNGEQLADLVIFTSPEHDGVYGSGFAGGLLSYVRQVRCDPAGTPGTYHYDSPQVPAYASAG